MINRTSHKRPETYSNGIRVRVDAINDEFVERSLELEVRYLPLLEVQPQSWDPARDARSSQHGSLGRRFMVIECLALCFRRRAQRHLTRGAASRGCWRRGRRGRGRRARSGRRWGADVGRSTKKTDDGRIAVMQLGHRVEEVGDEARATAHGFRRKVRRCNASRGIFSANKQIFARGDSVYCTYAQ